MLHTKALSFIVLAALFAGATWEQTTTATLSGVIQDASGAVVPSATDSGQKHGYRGNA